MAGSKQTPHTDLLRAPGKGIFAFSTGSASAERALGRYFSKPKFSAWAKEVRTRIRSADFGDPFFLLGIPSDSGGGICRGAAHGPMHIRRALFEKNRIYSKYDLGDIPCIPHLLHDEMLNSKQLRKSGQALWGTKYSSSKAVSPLSVAEEVLVEVWRKNPNAVPFILGGDHSVSWPAFAAMKRVGKTKNLAVLHFDAHTDLLEERLGVRICFGTWTSHAVRMLKRPEAWVQAGIRATGRSRGHWENKFGIQQYWARELRRRDPVTFAKGLVKRWQELGCESLYVTIDIDGLDGAEAPATGTPEGGGLKLAWTKKVIRHCLKEMKLVGADLTEVAPVLGAEAGKRKTLRAAVSLIEEFV